MLKAEGRDTGGKGNASALITAQLESLEPEVTKVTVTTDLTITGKVAQFGRGALADVSEKLLRQFVNNLETTVLQDGGVGAAVAATAGRGRRRAAEPTAPAEPRRRRGRTSRSRGTRRGRSTCGGGTGGAQDRVGARSSRSTCWRRPVRLC